MRGAGLLLFALLGSIACSPDVPLGEGNDSGVGGKGGSGGSGADASAGSGGSGGTVTTGGSGGGSAGSPDIFCSIVAAGSLPDPISPTANITGPAVVATDSGFVIGYRDQSFATLRAVAVSVSDNGILSAPAFLDLGGCAAKIPTDGVALAFASGAGLFVSSLPNCGNGAGAVFIPFDSKGNVGSASGPKNAAFEDLTVAQGGALAPTATPNEYEFIYRVVSTSGAGVVERVVLQGAGFKSSVPIDHPFGDGDTPFGLVATGRGTTGSIRAFVGQNANQLELQIGPLGGDTVQTMGTVGLPQAASGAVSAWNNRAAFVQPTGSGLAWTVAELSSNSVSALVNANPLGAGISGALATLGDHLYIVGGSPQKLSLWAVAGATGTLGQPGAPAELTGSIGSQSLAGFDGTSLAIAAARGRVVIVWRSKFKLSAGDPTGGFAILGCPS